MSAFNLVTSAGSFSAARRIPALPASHAGHRLHGHNFRAGASVLPDAAPALAPTLVRDLGVRLAQALEPLGHTDLNGLLDEPTDAALARWVGDRLADLPVQRVALMSTPEHGAELLADGTLQVWRRYRFESAHRLPNVAAGHKCGRMHGHGFAAVVCVQCVGAAAEVSGHDAIDRAWAPLHALLDQRCLNDIEGLANPTSELLSSWLWQRLRGPLPALARVAVFETASCGASYDGADYRIWKDFALDSAMRCAGLDAADPLAGLHGHTYQLRLALQAPLDTVMGWTVDFGDVKTVFDPVFRRLDHHPLHELPGGAGGTPALAAWILRTAAQKLPQLSLVELCETPGCGVVRCAEGRGAADLLLLPD